MNRGGAGPARRRPAKALGTGFIIRKDGLILTNNHVIDKADVIQIQLTEGDTRLYEAEVIGKDKRTDIALIKIKADHDLPVAQLGASGTLKVGEWVAAFGNPFGHGHSITKGIISAKGREIDEINRFPFLQTDASINPGNSGGPLVNMRGQVIGVNTAIDARAQGIGFAIPIDDVKSIIKILEKEGYIKRGYLGIYLSDIDPQNAKSILNLDTTEGAVITQVQEEGPAAKAGLKPYDFITEVNGHKVKNSNELIRKISDMTSGQKANFKLFRNGKSKTLKVVLGTHPESSPPIRQKKQKHLKPQKTLSQFGLALSNYSVKLKKQMDLPKLKKGRPVILNVSSNSMAEKSGLAPGDIILDVNKVPVFNVKAAEKELYAGRLNLLRILRGTQVFLVYLRP